MKQYQIINSINSAPRIQIGVLGDAKRPWVVRDNPRCFNVAGPFKWKWQARLWILLLYIF